MEMQEGFKDKILRMFVIVLVLAILVVGLVAAWPKYSLSRRLRQQDAELAAKIEKKRLEIAELKNNHRRYETDNDFVEAIARRSNRVFPGELVFMFDDE